MCLSGQRWPEEKGRCSQVMLKADDIEFRVMRWASNWLSDPERFGALLEGFRLKLEESGGLDSLNRARERLETLDKEKGRVLLQHQRGYINDGEMDLKIRALNEQSEYFRDELARAEAECGHILGAIETLRDGMLPPTPIEVMLRRLTVTGLLYPDDLQCTLNLDSLLLTGQAERKTSWPGAPDCGRAG